MILFECHICDDMYKYLNSFFFVFIPDHFFASRLPIYYEGESTAQTFTDILRKELAIHAKELKSANAMIDGDLVRRM